MPNCKSKGELQFEMMNVCQDCYDFLIQSRINSNKGYKIRKGGNASKFLED